MADVKQTAEVVATHLEFMGYDCEIKQESLIFANHPEKANITVSVYSNAVDITAIYGTKPTAQSNLSQLLQEINAVNRQMMLSRLYIDEEFDLWIKATLLVEYSRKPFNDLLKAFDTDFATLIENKTLVAFIN